MNEEARELAETWGCTPSNTCYWYCVEAAQREIDDDEDILCRSLELRVGESSGRAGSPERLAVVLNTVQACQVPKPWTLEAHFPVEQNILLDAGGYAISKDDSALTEEDVYELANRYVAFVSDNMGYIDLLTEFAHTTGSTVATAEPVS